MERNSLYWFARAINLTPNLTIDQLKKKVDTAIATGAILNFVNHKFTTDTVITDSMYFNVDVFKQLLDYIKSKNVDVISTSELLSLN